MNQSFTFVTFDMTASKLAYKAIWFKLEVFTNVFVHIGAFHIMCSYLDALRTFMSASGFEEVIVQT